MKHNAYNGQFLSMNLVTGDLNNVPLTVALVPSETKENYLWVFNKIKSIDEFVKEKLDNKRSGIYSDMDKGLLPAIATAFPMSRSMNCFKHIVANISASKSLTSVGSDVGMLWKLQGAISEHEYNTSLAELKLKYDKVGEYLENISGGRAAWALYPSIVENVPLFGHRTSNTIESENSRWLDVRHLNPLEFADTAVRKLVEINNANQQRCVKLERKNCYSRKVFIM